MKHKFDEELAAAVKKNDVMSLKSLLLAGAVATPLLMKLARGDGFETVEKLLIKNLTEQEEMLEQKKLESTQVEKIDSVQRKDRSGLNKAKKDIKTEVDKIDKHMQMVSYSLNKIRVLAFTNDLPKLAKQMQNLDSKLGSVWNKVPNLPEIYRQIETVEKATTKVT